MRLFFLAHLSRWIFSFASIGLRLFISNLLIPFGYDQIRDGFRSTTTTSVHPLLSHAFTLPFCPLSGTSPAMAFDWQTELASTVKALIPSTVVAPSNNYSPPKSFAQALVAATVTDSLLPLPTPVISDETLYIQISIAIYAQGVDVCKRNLGGRLILNKGDKPYGWREILTKLQQLWTNIGPWKMTLMGKGYLEFYFASYDDLRTVWAKGTLNLKPGLLRLFEWSKDFSARTQRQTHAQVWIRLLELPQEYWMDRTLREIACAIGTSLLIDSATQNRVFGRYARILVDMDLSKQIF